MRTVRQLLEGKRPGVVTIEASAVQVTFFRWEAERRRFRASDTFAFARAGGVMQKAGLVASSS